MANNPFPPMVSWYDPQQLLNTAYQTIVSTIIGEHSDPRRIEALLADKNLPHHYTHYHKQVGEQLRQDETRPRQEIWLDYIADVGDGWNSTYAVAYAASQPTCELKLKGTDAAYTTQRGALLLFGGDEVYPTPSRKEYAERLLAPYQAAFGETSPFDPVTAPHVFAIPGNHDWYDSLVAFTRVFCSDLFERRFAGWYAPQWRSYFALKLPAKWWLIAVDLQLHSNIDVEQLAYFQEIAESRMEEGDRVILCLAEPLWIKAKKYEDHGAPYDETDLLFLKAAFRKKNIEIALFLAGDSHYYRRHSEITVPLNADETTARFLVTSAKQKITAGGGGAFLHPTNREDVQILIEKETLPDGTSVSGTEYQLRESYPLPEVCDQLCWGNLNFIKYNPYFGIFTGIIYLFTGWAGYKPLRDVSQWAINEFSHNSLASSPRILVQAVLRAIGDAIQDPLVGFWIVLLIGGLIFFTDTHSKLHKWVGGLLHGLCHLLALLVIGSLAAALGQYWLGAPGSLCLATFGSCNTAQLLFGGVLVFFGGWLVGSLIMGAYLFVSQYFLGRHDNEAFSALKIEDYKNFLRLRIAPDGSLTIYPIKIERVPRKWRKRAEGDNTNSLFVAEESNMGVPELIEKPIRLRPASIAQIQPGGKIETHE